MKPRRPYLLRAMHEWISDNGWTPHMVVDASFKGVEVPRQFVQDGKIVLNLSWSATDRLQLGNDEVSFGARFGGSAMQVRVPIAAVLALYARETQQGMIFAEEDGLPPPEGPAPPDGGSGGPTPGAGPDQPPPGKPSPRARLKVVK